MDIGADVPCIGWYTMDRTQGKTLLTPCGGNATSVATNSWKLDHTSCWKHVLTHPVDNVVLATGGRSVRALHMRACVWRLKCAACLPHRQVHCTAVTLRHPICV
eukprot:UN0202